MINNQSNLAWVCASVSMQSKPKMCRSLILRAELYQAGVLSEILCAVHTELIE